MIRKLLLPLAATALLAGCATTAPYAYRGGAQGDYYYGSPSVQYRTRGVYPGYYGYGSPYYGGYGSGFSVWGGHGGFSSHGISTHGIQTHGVPIHSVPAPRIGGGHSGAPWRNPGGMSHTRPGHH